MTSPYAARDLEGSLAQTFRFPNQSLHLTACKSGDELVLENLALRQRVGTLKPGRHRPKLHDAYPAFWVALRKTWTSWARRLLIVKPETVVDWQRQRFRRHGNRISQLAGVPAIRESGPRSLSTVTTTGQEHRPSYWG